MSIGLKAESPRISDDVIKTRTRKNWQEWFDWIDQAGGATLSRAAMMELLAQAGVGPTWQELIVMAYTHSAGQRPSRYDISATKTVEKPVGKLFQAWTNESMRRRWLPGEPFVIRELTRNKSMRITWTDGRTHLDVNFYSKTKQASRVAVQHKRLTSPTEAARCRAFWTEALERFKLTVERGAKP